MTTYAYVQIEIPDDVEKSKEEIEEETGGKVFMFSVYPSDKQLILFEEGDDELIQELEGRGYRVSKD